MTHELDVWLFANRIGTLALVSGRLMFRYAAEWLMRTDAVPLSHSLPLRAESFDDHAARPFFAGLLPEGRLRRMVARQFHVSAQNDFALLDHIGGECAGAVTFLEPGQPLLQQSSGSDVEWLSDESIIAILEELPRRPMLAGKDGLRLSLAGAQDKLPVTVDGSRIGLPRDGTASTHILKHWGQFAEAAGLAKAQTRKRILELARTLPEAARQLQSAPDSGFSGHPLVESIIRVIEQRSALTVRRLTEPTGND